MQRDLLFLFVVLYASFAKAVKLKTASSSPLKPSFSLDTESSEEEDEVDTDLIPQRESMSWIMSQAGMYQTRLALLSVELEKKGYAVKGVIPQPRGLICAQSSKEYPLRCRVYMEPEEGSKVVAPCRCKGSQKWIAIKALNQQRRRDPLKWTKCPICQTHMDYSIYESCLVGLDRLPTQILNHRTTSRVMLAVSLFLGVLLLGVIFKGLFIRILISETLWGNWDRISGLAGGGLTLYILGFQWARKRLGRALSGLEDRVRGELTEMESAIMERSIPVTMTAKEAEESMGS